MRQVGTKESPKIQIKPNMANGLVGMELHGVVYLYHGWVYAHAGYPLGNIGFRKGFAGCQSAVAYFKKHDKSSNRTSTRRHSVL